MKQAKLKQVHKKLFIRNSGYEKKVTEIKKFNNGKNFLFQITKLKKKTLGS